MRIFIFLTVGEFGTNSDNSRRMPKLLWTMVEHAESAAREGNERLTSNGESIPLFETEESRNVKFKESRKDASNGLIPRKLH